MPARTLALTCCPVTQYGACQPENFKNELEGPTFYPASVDLSSFLLNLKAFLEKLLCIRECPQAGSESVLYNIVL